MARRKLRDSFDDISKAFFVFVFYGFFCLIVWKLFFYESNFGLHFYSSSIFFSSLKRPFRVFSFWCLKWISCFGSISVLVFDLVIAGRKFHYLFTPCGNSNNSLNPKIVRRSKPFIHTHDVNWCGFRTISFYFFSRHVTQRLYGLRSFSNSVVSNFISSSFLNKSQKINQLISKFPTWQRNQKTVYRFDYRFILYWNCNFCSLRS